MKTNTSILRISLALSIIALAGCAQAAIETSASATPADTATPAPPTATFTPAVSPTPIPTANFTLADIIGTWFRSDPDRGNLYMIFQEGGGYLASHGTPDGVVHAGKYTLDGRVFTFVDGWNCSPLGETEGKYILRLGGGGNFLLFETLDDKCPDRPSALKSVRWDKVETP